MAEAEAVEGADGEVPQAAQLKQLGNGAYARGDVEEAVQLWNRAIRQHVQELEGGKACDEEATTLERSIYLNLAQGYLKLGDAERAIRACQVVLYTDPANSKARFRGAEAAIQLQRFDEARALLEPLAESLPEAARLQKKLLAEEREKALRDRKEEAEAQKRLAQRMSAGLRGFAEDKPEPVNAEAASSSRAPPMADLNTVSNMTDISNAAAQAAQARAARLEASEGPPLPAATYTDLDSFRAKAMKRSQKYTLAAQRSRKQGEAAQRSVRLDWLRAGRETSELEGFAAPLREELRELEAEEAQRADAEEVAAEAEGAGEGGGGEAWMAEMD